MEHILEVTDLAKIFPSKRRFFLFKTRDKPFVAVKGISFHLKRGEILGILGPNGAGKTTTIQMLLGALKPTKGSILYFGKDFETNKRTILPRLAYASAYNKLPGSLTVLENLDIYGRLYGLKSEERKKRIDQLLEGFGIEDLKKKQADSLSAGQLTRTLLAKAFLSKPEIVLLDEPTASLDPDIAVEVRRFILRQKEESGASVILTSHNMVEVSEVCDRVLAFQKGIIIQEDTPQNMARSAAQTRLSLTISENMEIAGRILEENKWRFEKKDHHLEIELDEPDIPRLLIELTQKNVGYTHIEIEKPTLEDYFLHLSKGASK